MVAIRFLICYEEHILVSSPYERAMTSISNGGDFGNTQKKAPSRRCCLDGSFYRLIFTAFHAAEHGTVQTGVFDVH